MQPPLKPYSDGVLCIFFLLNIIFWICAFVDGGVGNFGKSAITGSIITFLIMDWKGFTSLDGWIKWNQFSGTKKFWLSCLFILLIPIASIVYLVRRVNAFSQARKQKMPALPYRKGRPALAIVAGFFAFIIVLVGSTSNASSGPGTDTTTTTSAPTQQVAHTEPTQMPIQKPTATPMPTPSPTPTPTPKPAQAPVQQSVQQQAPVKQAPPPAQLFVSFTGESAVDNSSGSVSVHTLPGAALTISVKYCTGSYATSSSLKGTQYADSAGNHTWSWVPDTKCKGTATAYVTASLNGQSAGNSANFTVS